ncbi:MAG: DNA internalization-related competence protein ComEC/Rec2, partial [bacterium]|nr:DNA internalization-related competence protein ComEC/Rec2 [bacterium]
YITVEGELKSFPQIRPDHSILVLEVYRLEYERNTMAVSFNVSIKVKGDLSGLYRGDRVAVDAKLYRNTLNSNFFPNPIENLRLVRNNHFNGYCKSAELVRVTEKTNGFWRFMGGWRNKIRGVIETKYMKQGDDRGESGQLDERGVLLEAILLGERGQLSNDQKDRLISAGVYHLLAISGAHIGIIALLCLGFLRLLKVSFRTRYIVTGLVLIFFLVLSGFKISAERAVLMALLIFIARILYLGTDIFNVISVCGLIILARDPAEFLDAGFILTFTLTTAIVMGRKILLPLLGKAVPDQESSLWGGVRQKVRAFGGELLSANLSAALIALPLSLYYFKRYSFGGFFAGLLLVPLTGVIIALGFLLIPLALVSHSLSYSLLWVMDWPLRLFFSITGFFSSALDLSIYRASPAIIWVMVILVAFAFLSVSRSKRQKIILASVVLAVCLLITVNIFSYSPDHLEVYYLDVGQGDAQVVVFPGGDGLLIDGGGVHYSDFQVGKHIVLPFLLQKRINIKWVAVSHYDADHVGGIIEIIGVLEPEELWLSSEASGERLYRDLLGAVPSSTRVVEIAAPLERKIGGCLVRWVYPEGFLRGERSDNDQSQVMRVSDAYHSFLFTGDIEREAEMDLVDAACAGVDADVIKVPHHGSSTSSGWGFLKCVDPKLAIFSYALNNRFRFPHKNVVANYKRLKTPFLATAKRGGIKITSLPTHLQIKTSR